MKLLVISPHLDDAALSCAWLLQHHPWSRVVSVFAGMPPNALTVSTDWDRNCGFASAGAAIEARRYEDECACQKLDADPIWLDFADGQYGRQPRQAALEEQFESILEKADGAVVVIPLGLHHPDHIAVSDAALVALQRQQRTCIAYHETPYRALPGVVEKRITCLTAAGFSLQALSELSGSIAWKNGVVETYASQWPRLQIDALLDARDVLRPERFSTVATPRQYRRDRPTAVMRSFRRPYLVSSQPQLDKNHRLLRQSGEGSYERETYEDRNS